MGWYYFSYFTHRFGWLEINPNGKWFASWDKAALHAIDLAAEYKSSIRFGKKNNKMEFMTP